MEDISDAMIFENAKQWVLVPIPSSKKRRSERGFNQAELIARKIFEYDEGKNFSCDTSLLFKIKDTPHQSELKNRAERLKNLIGAFSASGKCSGKNIILIDDVITTGTTMNEAAKVLKKSGAKKVLGFSIAH